MDALPELLHEIAGKLMQYANLQTGFQVAGIAAAIAVAGIVHRIADRSIERQLERKHPLPVDFAMRAVRRLIFPLAGLAVLFVLRLVLQAFERHVELLEIAANLLLALAIVRVLVYALRVGFTSGPALQAWEKIISTTVWAIVALHLVGWLQPVVDGMDSLSIKTGDSQVSLLMVLKLTLLSALYLFLALWISNIIEQRLRASRHVNASLRVGLSKMVKFFLLALAILMVLNEAGLDLSSLAIFGGALGVGLGFGLQKIVSNFISGFILLGDRSIRPGDVITVGENFGWVKELRARYIVVQNRDGVETLIPNENLITSDVINWSYSDRRVRMRVPVQISYDDDPRAAMEIMLAAGKAHPRTLKQPAPVVRLMEFADSGIALELRIWMTDPEEGVGNIKSDINLAIWDGFKEAGITIPFPQRDVNLRYMNAAPAE